MILSFKVCVASNAQFTQNKMSGISLQYVKKEVSDEVDILHPDKHESLLQIGTMILMGIVKNSRSSQNNEFVMSSQ